MAIKLPDIFQDGMILQRDKKIKIWGQADPNSPVSVQLGDSEVVQTISDEKGNFSVYLAPQEPATGLSLNLKSNDDQIKFSNVGVGEVYLLAGQSNMNLILRYDHEYHTHQDKVLADIPNNISIYEVPKLKLNSPKDPLFGKKGEWKKLSKKTAENFSAAGFYFGLELAKRLKDMPIALIWMAYDGTTASTWTSKEALEGNPILKKTYVDSYEKLLAERPKGEYEKFLKMVAEQSKNPENGPFWDNVLMGNVSHDDLCEAYKNHHELFVDYVMGPESENRPHGLFDTMVSKIIGYTFKAMLWYQGESDDAHAEVYDTLLTTMINDWRNRWNDNFPVLEMQIAPFYHWFGVFYGTYFPYVREKQQIVAEQMPNVYMTNVMDAGMKYDIHPKNKKIAGHRFAMLAFDKIYGWEKHQAAPLVINKCKNGNEIELAFSETSELNINSGLSDVLKIEVAGKEVDFRHHTFENRLVLSINGESIGNKPVSVTYQWQPYSEARMFNESKVPVSPFDLSL